MPAMLVLECGSDKMQLCRQPKLFRHLLLMLPMQCFFEHFMMIYL